MSRSSLPGTLVIIRHGESEWNALGKWTGHTDVHLSAKGYRESAMMGEKLRDVKFDHVYYSQQIRTKETLEGVLDASRQPDVPYEVSPALNERDYGIYTGKNKWEVQKEIGEAAFHAIRRGWDVPVEEGETLKMVYERTLPFYQDTVLPRLKRGETVLLIAHGNSTRSLMKYIENISDGEIGNVEMIFGTALIYRVDDEGRLTHKETREIDTTPPPA